MSTREAAEAIQEIHWREYVHPLEPDGTTDDWTRVSCYQCLGIGPPAPWEQLEEAAACSSSPG